MSRIEPTIIRNLIEDEDYSKKVVPYIKPNYFRDEGERVVFEEIVEFYRKYNKKPTVESIRINLGQNKFVTERAAKSADVVLDGVPKIGAPPDSTWLLNETESFCQNKAIYLGMMECIEIADGKSKTKAKGSIPQILTEALSITFDPHIGHDYLDDSDARFTYYTNVEEKLEFDLDILNKATNGGVGRKTLNILLGGIHAGKTLGMCSLAASYILQGKNVLYLTLEMSEKEISRRIDANLLDTPISQLGLMPKTLFDTKINALKAKTNGKLIVKEYPTAGAGADNFRSLLNDLRLKRNFKPDVIFVDYLNLCSSNRYKAGNHDSYTFIKAVAEELRGLAIEFDVPLWSATQMNRSGMNSSDPGMTDTSESIALPALADLMWAIYRNDELDKNGLIQVKQLKNRYGDIANQMRFVLGLDRVKMRLFEPDNSLQSKVAQDPNQLPATSMSKPKLNTTATVEPDIAWDMND